MREMFGAAASDFEFERHSATIDAESVEAWADFFIERFGPLVTARDVLGERFGELREQIIGIWEQANEADDGRLRLPQEYLLSVIRL